MEIKVEQTLKDLVQTYGPDIISDGKRLEAFLRDLCADNKKEINVLIAAHREKIPQKISLSKNLTPDSGELKIIIRQFIDETGVSEEAGDWAVKAWAGAINFKKEKSQPNIKIKNLKTTETTIIKEGEEEAPESVVLESRKTKKRINSAVKLVKVREKRVLTLHSAAVSSLAFSPDGKLLLSGSRDGSVKIRDLSGNFDYLSYPGNSEWIFDVTFSPDGKYFAYAGGIVNIFDLENKCLHQSFRFEKYFAQSVAFSFDSAFIIIGFRNGTIKIIDINSKVEKRSFQAHNDIVYSISASSDGRFFATGSRDKTLKLRYFPNGFEYKSFTEHTDWVLSASFSTSGKFLISAGSDETIICRNLITGQQPVSFNGHLNIVTSVKFLYGEVYCASVAMDSTVKVWDVATGVEVWGKNIETRGLHSLAVSFDGMNIAVGCEDGSIRIFELIYVPEFAIELFKKMEREKQLAFQRVGSKDEYESMPEYLARFNKEKGMLDVVYDKKFAIEKKKLEETIHDAVESSEKRVVLRIQEIGDYDADRESLPLIIEGDYKLIKLSAHEAKIFKQSYQRAIVRATRRLKTNLSDYEYLSVTIYVPELDRTYKF